MRSPRADAALADLSAEFARRGFTTEQEIRRVAARYSDTTEEAATLERMLQQALQCEQPLPPFQSQAAN